MNAAEIPVGTAAAWAVLVPSGLAVAVLLVEAGIRVPGWVRWARERARQWRGLGQGFAYSSGLSALSPRMRRATYS